MALGNKPNPPWVPNPLNGRPAFWFQLTAPEAAGGLLEALVAIHMWWLARYHHIHVHSAGSLKAPIDYATNLPHLDSSERDAE